VVVLSVNYKVIGCSNIKLIFFIYIQNYLFVIIQQNKFYYTPILPVLHNFSIKVLLINFSSTYDFCIAKLSKFI